MTRIRAVLVAVVAAVLLLCAACSGHASTTGDQVGPGTSRTPSTTTTITSTTTSTASGPGSLTGDVDGDGRPDRVSLSGVDVTVALASGRRLDATAPVGSRLLGLARVGGPGRAVVVGPRRGTAEVLRLPATPSDHTLLRVPRASGVSLDNRRAEVTWVTTSGRLLSGRVRQPGRPQTPVYASVRTVADGRVRAGSTTRALCWDRSSPVPGRCTPGQDVGPQVGLHADLPSLYPASARRLDPARPRRIGGVTVRVIGLRHVDGAQSGLTVELTDRHGGEHTAALPDGPYPALLGQPISVSGPPGSFAFVLEQQGGDSSPDQVFVWDGSTLQHLEATGPVPLGDAFLPAGLSSSWISAAGSLYTRTPRGPGARGTHAYRYDVRRWTVRGDEVVPVDLGAVCIADVDATLSMYGRC